MDAPCGADYGTRGDIITDRTVTITFCGALPDAGLPDIAVVLPAIEAFADAFRLMLRHRHTQVAGHRPPYPALLSASALRLSSVDAASGSVTLAIAAPAPLGKLADAPREGLTALLSTAAAAIRSLPEEVSFPLRRIADALPDGIDSVAIAGSPVLPAPPLTLTRAMFAAALPQHETFVCNGRLHEVNWSRGTAVLGSWQGICLLVFPPDLAEKMRAAADRIVTVAGAGERTADGVTIIREIERIHIHNENGGRMKLSGPFEADVQQALAIIRWEEKQREWIYDDELDAWADELLKEALEK